MNHDQGYADHLMHKNLWIETPVIDKQADENA
jgi:hypothetical protein